MPRVSLLVLAVLIAMTAAVIVGYLRWPDPQIRRGMAIYAAECAACHGAALQGQPDWKIPGPDGILPAPPHDETGHTWHHSDAMLGDYIRLGGQVVLDRMGANSTSGMPGFGDRLNEAEIAAVLAFLKSRWPADLRRHQQAQNPPN